jgi:hypothetical protein
MVYVLLFTSLLLIEVICIVIFRLMINISSLIFVILLFLPPSPSYYYLSSVVQLIITDFILKGLSHELDLAFGDMHGEFQAYIWKNVNFLNF